MRGGTQRTGARGAVVAQDRRALIVGTDGGAAAWAAVREAARIAADSGYELHVVSAYGASERNRARAEQLLARTAAELTASGPLAPAGLHALRDRPSDALCHAAELVGATLIVVGNRGTEDHLRVLQRPICHRVRRRAGCEVLVLDTSTHWRGRVDDPELTPLTRAEPMAFWIERPEPGWRLYLGGLRVHHGLVGELLALDGIRRRTRFGLLELAVGTVLLADDWRDWPFGLRE